MPPPSAIGDTSALYVMGWIRFFHLACGYLLTVACHHASMAGLCREAASRTSFSVPAVWRAEWLDGFMRQMQWNL